ncbi:MAG: IS21-like element helper ATPase IstB [Bacteroidota bacterium]
MNTTETLQQLQQLKLHGMAASYHTQLELPVHQQLEAHEMIAQLTQSELLARNNERTTYFLKLAKLRLPAMPEHIECSATPQPDQTTIKQFTGRAVHQRRRNSAYHGPTGCGKSYLACGLGYQACIQGYKTQYMNMNRLIEKITLAKLDGSYIKLLNHFERIPLIILDDFGLQPLDQTIRVAMLQILEDRYAKKSVIITSQLPVAKWHAYINEPTLADAILDRLTAKAQRIELKGESMRRKKQ